MKVVLFGATGNVGTAVAHELVSRGHEVTAASRGGQSPEGLELETVAVDLAESAQVIHAVRGHDAIVSTFGPRHGSDDDASVLITATHNLIEAARHTTTERLVVIGGAGSLEVSPGVRVIDQPDFPDEWRANALAQIDALELYREVDNINWTYLSPAAFLGPGERTGSFRIGKDTLLIDEAGQSKISYADFAIFLVDELEQGNAVRHRITAAY
jgi:putative NADH-flavin reductase